MIALITISFSAWWIPAIISVLFLAYMLYVLNDGSIFVAFYTPVLVIVAILGLATIWGVSFAVAYFTK